MCYSHELLSVPGHDCLAVVTSGVGAWPSEPWAPDETQSLESTGGFPGGMRCGHVKLSKVV